MIRYVVSLPRFITRSDITDYVDTDQLQTQFGGQDSWEYVFDREEMRHQVQLIWNATEEEEKHVQHVGWALNRV